MYIEQTPGGKYRYAQTYTDLRTGKQKRVYVTLSKNTATYRTEAARILQEKIDLANADAGDVSKLTLKQLSDLYVNSLAKNVKATTLRRNAQKTRVYCRVLGEDTRVAGLTARFVSQRFAASGRANRTINEDMIRFKAFMRWAYKHDYVDDVKWLDKLDPLPDTTTKERDREKYLEGDELQRLMPELTVERNRLMIAFLALSGLRIGEAIALEGADVDTQRRVIHVTKTFDHAAKKTSEGAKTYASNRDVYMQDELHELCGQIRKFMRKDALQHGYRSKYFFTDEKGRPIQYARINKYFAEKCEKNIGRRLTIHSLRHTHASLMFEAKVSLEAVAARLGHADSKVTREIYLHVTKRLQEQYNAEVKGVRML